MQDERGIRSFFVSPIAPRQSGSGDVQFSGNPDGTWIERLLEHVILRVGHGPAIGDALPFRIDLSDGIAYVPYRRFRGPTGTHDFNPFDQLSKAIRKIHGNAVSR